MNNIGVHKGIHIKTFKEATKVYIFPNKKRENRTTNLLITSQSIQLN